MTLTQTQPQTPQESAPATPLQQVTADDIALAVSALYDSGSLPAVEDIARLIAGSNRRERAVITGFFRRLGAA
ncbi:hypothetical protein [Leifsonia sp. AG29]|uniref:hypothetical protein n=1 Tax=Leifsonia sp. AG29 TaxID=2598860 RepID=UPI00131DB77E|nr:hypothetical protein [Leifsonia sp. AG29]